MLTRKKTGSFGDIDPTRDIAYRSMEKTQVTNDVIGYAGEFSIMSALANVPVLHSLMDSPNAHHRNEADRMMKDAAILYTTKKPYSLCHSPGREM